MEYVRLAPGLPPSSRLGFGCGSVMGRVGRAASLRAIAAALGAGITHFDVARLYGYGEAEAVLGEALRGRREQVVIASKFGLVATRAAVALRGLKPLAQKFVAAMPGLRPLIRAAVGTNTSAADRFSAAAAERSLNESLQALQTDYLDILLLHDAAAADLNPELLDFLDTQVAAGRIRTYGLASGPEAVAAALPVHGDRLLYQFGNSVCVRNAERLAPAKRKFLAHNPFIGADRLQSLCRAQPGALRLPDGPPVAAADIHRLMLHYALAVDSVAVVLCSMLDPRHLRANIAAAEQPGFSGEEIAAFAAAVRALDAAGAHR